ncbi:MAG: uracil-DNA glycosylase [Bacteroidetes bacterium]|nr:MAG: uracil-DNA glycosylase [Bacteroidota bacterium]
MQSEKPTLSTAIPAKTDGDLTSINPTIDLSWKKELKSEFEKPYFHEIKKYLLDEKSQGKLVYPPSKLIFSAFNTTPFEEVKVVILGQDPYHGSGQAHGLSFSVPDNVPTPPSLVNIFKELNSDLEIPLPASGNLLGWAKQGVLLLNAMLSVRANSPASHRSIGWEQFTNAAIKALSENRSGLVFMLWGKFAKEKAELINPEKHLILKSTHPSPFSANYGFFGCKHFSKANKYLQEHGTDPIEWKVEDRK